MLKRARMFGLIAMIAALFGFTGIIQASAPLAQVVAYFFIAFSLLSLLLGLFEEGDAEVTNSDRAPASAPEPSASPVTVGLRH
jgi:uncharacterized membrane protein YtjA (UPF0391 family)